MTTEVLTDARVEYDSVDLSAFVTSVALTYESEAQDDTAMGDDTRSNLGGLKNWSAEIEFNQDFAASGPDATLFAKVGSIANLKIRKTSAAIGSTNPEYSGDALLTSYPPFGNSVGDKATTSASFVPGGTNNTLARADS